MAAVVIGALRVDLGLSTASFRKDANAAAREAEQLGSKFKSVGLGIAAGGAAITAGITMPFVGLMKSAIPAAQGSMEAIGQVNAALTSMGPLAGRTSDQLADFAAKLQATSTIDDDDILRDLTANMLTFGKIAGTEFDRAQQAALDMSVRMKTDLKSASILVGKALNDPVKGMGALRKAGVQLSETQQKQVKDFVAVGDVASAQRILLGELESQFAGSAQAQRDATPGADMTDAWREFQETLGAIAIEYLPPLTSALSSVLSAFTSLSPGMQTAIVGATAFVAIMGPVLIGVGAVVTAIGTLVTAAPAVATAFGVIKAATMSLMISPLGLVVAAVGAVVAAWYYWDEIVAVVKRVGQAVSDWYSANVKPTVDAVLAALRPVVDFFASIFGPAIQAQIEIVSRLLSGDFSGAFTAAKDFALSALGGIVTAFVGLHLKAIEAVAALAAGVRDWIQGRLGAVFNWLKDKLAAVGGYFFDLYDAVVGHSYVPDMVDGIAAHIGRLQGVMVDPAKKAAGSVKQSMADMARDTVAVLARLFPEIEKAKAYSRDLALINNSTLSDDQKAEARKRLAYEDMGIDRNEPVPVTVANDNAPLVDPDRMDEVRRQLEKLGDVELPGFRKKTWEETQKVVEAYAGMARNVLGSLRGMVQAFKGGDIIGGIIGLADLIVQVVQGIGAIKGMSAPKTGSTGYQTPSYGGARALGGAVVPGKRYRIGERGPEYVSFGARGHITPENDNGGRIQAIFNGVMTSDEFWQRIDELDNQASMRGAMGGATMVQERSAKRARSRLGGR